MMCFQLQPRSGLFLCRGADSDGRRSSNYFSIYFYGTGLMQTKTLYRPRKLQTIAQICAFLNCRELLYIQPSDVIFLVKIPCARADVPWKQHHSLSGAKVNEL